MNASGGGSSDFASAWTVVGVFDLPEPEVTEARTPINSDTASIIINGAFLSTFISADWVNQATFDAGSVATSRLTDSTPLAESSDSLTLAFANLSACDFGEL